MTEEDRKTLREIKLMLGRIEHYLNIDSDKNIHINVKEKKESK